MTLVQPKKWYCLLQVIHKYILLLFIEMRVAQLRIHHLQMWFSVSCWRHFPELSHTSHGCFLGLPQCCCESKESTKLPIFTKILGKGIGIRKVTWCSPGSYDLTVCPMVFLNSQKLSHTFWKGIFFSNLTGPQICTRGQRCYNSICRGIAQLPGETTIKYHPRQYILCTDIAQLFP